MHQASTPPQSQGNVRVLPRILAKCLLTQAANRMVRYGPMHPVAFGCNTASVTQH